MTNKELAIELLDMIPRDDVKTAVLINAVMRLLDEPDQAEPKVKKKTGRKKEIDWGKADACRKAGWSVPKIADELKCSEAAVYNHFKEAAS